MPLNTSPRKFKTERYDMITEIIPNPAVGAVGTWACPDNRVVEVLSVIFVLNSCGVAGNRYPYMALERGGLTSHFTLSNVFLAPAGNYSYRFSLGIDAVDLSATNGVVFEPLAAAWEMKAGDNLLIQAYNFNAGDWFSGLRLRYREWKED